MLKQDLNNLPNTTEKVIQSEDLLQGARELVIKHGDEVYRLRLTNQGKLILTK